MRKDTMSNNESTFQKKLPLALTSKGCESVKEMEDVLEKVVKFAVRTTHPHFYNQLYGGLDEVALGGAWLLEALNTNQWVIKDCRFKRIFLLNT